MNTLQSTSTFTDDWLYLITVPSNVVTILFSAKQVICFETSLVTFPNLRVDEENPGVDQVYEASGMLTESQVRQNESPSMILIV
ncbi:hypothetical protein DPMN_079486 [Dreissena polymorpha]|uniref:Uncharacterized protein n=1 Tax=Dreissena polymorpha TaxID=45954 RepID=A0A9D4BIE6_DREPO|nr:hypothetical protein DPMN_079486 [Dreissena polymorpha]